MDNKILVLNINIGLRDSLQVIFNNLVRRLVCTTLTLIFKHSETHKSEY